MRENTECSGIEMQAPEDYAMEAEASLISFPAGESSGKAILYIHGCPEEYDDNYIGEYFSAKGYDFHIIDLRCGLPNMHHRQFNSLDDYFPLIDAAINIIASQGNSHITMVGRSFGGLIASLYCASGKERRQISKLILKAPELELNKGWLKRKVTIPVAEAMDKLRRRMAKSKPSYDNPMSASYYMDERPDAGMPGAEEAFAAYHTWLKALREGQKRVRNGLNIQIPVLVLLPEKSSGYKSWNDDALVSDIITDADYIKKYKQILGANVTHAEVPDSQSNPVFWSEDVRKNVLSAMLEFTSGADPFMAVMAVFGQ